MFFYEVVRCVSDEEEEEEEEEKGGGKRCTSFLRSSSQNVAWDMSPTIILCPSLSLTSPLL